MRKLAGRLHLVRAEDAPPRLADDDDLDRRIAELVGHRPFVLVVAQGPLVWPGPPLEVLSNTKGPREGAAMLRAVIPEMEREG